MGTRFILTVAMLSYGDHPHAYGDKIVFSMTDVII